MQYNSMFLATIPAVIWVDSVGRKPVLVSGAFLMAACHIIIAILTGLFEDSWSKCVLIYGTFPRRFLTSVVMQAQCGRLGCLCIGVGLRYCVRILLGTLRLDPCC